MSDNNILTQDDIDALLQGDFSLDRILISSIEELHEYLANDDENVLKYRGLFTKEAKVVSFFGDTKSGEILNEIKAKNAAEGLKPMSFGEINLINFSYCPNCNLAYSWNELNEYYSKPFIPEGKTTIEIMRKDTRVKCRQCGDFYLPALLIETESPCAEVQYLCRIQLVDAIEDYMERPVLSKKKSNLIFKPNSRKLEGIKQDITINDLADDKTLVTNLIQYTPYPQTLRMVNGDYENMYVLGGFTGK